MRFEQSGYAKDNQTLQQWETLDGWQEVRGYDFNSEFNVRDFLAAYATTGIQATNLARAIDIAREMQQNNVFTFLSATSNMGSSGVRDIIRYLIQNKKIHCLVTSAGAIEEDIIKTIKPFVIGTFDAPGRMLFDKGIGRIGNIFAPYDRYLHFERFMQPIFDEIAENQKDGSIATPSEVIRLMGERANNEESFLYWAAKNDIPVFCPAFTDGSIGDLLHFARQKYKDLAIDIVGDHDKIVKLVLEQETTGAILLGGGSPKHYVLNANIFKEGLDYAIYLTTATEHDASDSGGNPQEAISWAKIKPDGKATKVTADASITFPLVVAGMLMK